MEVISSTARKHLVKALSKALRIDRIQAAEILSSYANVNNLVYLTGPMHGVQALICEASMSTGPTAHLFRDTGNGYEAAGILRLQDNDLENWRLLEPSEAHAIAAEIAGNLYIAPSEEVAIVSAHWHNVEIIGYENCETRVELDFMIDDDLHNVCFESNPFGNDWGALLNYSRNLLGCKVDVLLAPPGDADLLGIDHKIIVALPGGAFVPAIAA